VNLAGAFGLENTKDELLSKTGKNNDITTGAEMGQLT